MHEASNATLITFADAQITFETGPDGHATGLVLHQNGRNIPGKRVGD